MTRAWSTRESHYGRPPQPVNGEQALRPIFEPRSVGVIGASANPRKRGHQVVAALLEAGFAGPIIPVNPRGGEILGIPVVESIAEPADPPELVYVATPAATVPGVVRDCGEAGVRAAIVPAVGFKESGPEGEELERALGEAAREFGIRVVGPNTSGLLNTHAGLHMVGGEPLAPGGLAIVSQSGNVALDLMTSAARGPLGVSIYVGPGNECDVRFDEIIDFLAHHEPTKAIVMYVEGVRDGRSLCGAAMRLGRKKPLVVLKGGRSEAGTSAAKSHTGAIAGPYRVFRTAAWQSEMIEVDRSDELLPVAEALALQPATPRRDESGAGFVVISDGGGHGTIAADRFASLGIDLARLSPKTQGALEDLLGPASSASNPVDAAGAPDAAPSVLARAVKIASSDPACCGILLIGLFGGYAIRFSSSLEAEELQTAEDLAAAATGVPLVVHSLYAHRRPEALERLRSAGVPVSGSLEIAAACCAGLWRYSRYDGFALAEEGLKRRGPPSAKPRHDADPRSGWMSESETRELVTAHGVPVVPGVSCRDESEIRQLVAHRPGPWAVKAVAAPLPHKTDVGAVRLGVTGEAGALEAAEACRTAAARHVGASAVTGVLFTQMLPPPIAELLIDIRRDESFGTVLTIGFGGVLAELDPDLALRLAPFHHTQLDAMIGELKKRALLQGYRGDPPIDFTALWSLVDSLGRAFDAGELDEIELNPVFCYADGVIAVDAVARRRGAD
ncbi:MAG: acetate--CoA ligase family protein [Gemmatimonadota bacterium]|nr:acetate--CoA ligase family protein [Gemmatimonadota bacterium]